MDKQISVKEKLYKMLLESPFVLLCNANILLPNSADGEARMNVIILQTNVLIAERCGWESP